MTHSSQDIHGTPRLSVADVQRLAAMEISLPSRVGHTALLIVSLLVAIGIGSLWATEPALPLRTRVAFGVMTGIAIGWSVFAAWVLRGRRVLFGRDRVIAAAMGLAFSTMGATGMAAIGYWGGLGRPLYVAALVNVLLAAIAGVLLIRAKRFVADLARRRGEAAERMGRSS